jgi:hypothetical protein
LKYHTPFSASKNLIEAREMTHQRLEHGGVLAGGLGLFLDIRQS